MESKSKRNEDCCEDEFGSLLLWPSVGLERRLGRRKGLREQAEGEKAKGEEEEQLTNSDSGGRDTCCGQPNVGGSCSSGGNNAQATGETTTAQRVSSSSQVKEKQQGEQQQPTRPMDNNGHWRHRQTHLDNLQVNNKQHRQRAADGDPSNKLNYSKIFRQYLPAPFGQPNQANTRQSLLTPVTSNHLPDVTNNNDNDNNHSSSSSSSFASFKQSDSSTGTKFRFKFKSKSSKSEQRPKEADNQTTHSQDSNSCSQRDNKSQQVSSVGNHSGKHTDSQFGQRGGRFGAETKSVSKSLASAWSKFRLSSSSSSSSPHPSGSPGHQDNQAIKSNNQTNQLRRKEFLYLKSGPHSEAHNVNSIRLISHASDDTHKTRLLDDFDQQQELYLNSNDNNNNHNLGNFNHTQSPNQAKRMETRTRRSSGDRTALISFLTLSSALLVVFVLLFTCQPAASLQPQQQSPFLRSQLQPTSSSGPSASSSPNSNSNANNNQQLPATGGSLIAAELPPQSLRAPQLQTGRLQGGGPSAQTAGAPPQPAAGSLVATINCNKIRGHVTLTPNTAAGSSATTVTTQISAGPPGEVYQWSIHQFPVKPGAAMCSCSPLILGTKLIDLSEMHGNLPSSEQEFSVQSSLQLFGSESPVGHSLLLRGIKTGMLACATFLPTSRKSNYRAKFHSPISGSVTIFQTAFGTSFISHLMYSNGTRRHSQHRFDLIVKSDDDVLSSPVIGGPADSMLAPSGGRAFDQNQAQLELREHENELQNCRRFATLTSTTFQDNSQQHQPLFRNLTYQLSVSTENFGMRGRTALVLPPIPFETFASVYVVIYSEHDPGEPVACAPLRFVKPKTAAAKFQSHSVQGSVVFSQDSPYDVTLARINLNFPNSDGHSYGIDELPMIIRRKSDTRVCPNIREIIYNPHHVEPSSVPPEGEATTDQYAVGDLSGKYGSLTGKASEKIQVSDFNLPLFGPVSVIGRALTIYSSDGVAIACSNVELTSPMTTAFATFDFGIQGQFIFRQPMNDCNGDTYVYIEVSKPTSGGAAAAAAASSTASTSADHAGHHQHQRSIDHNWHIHANAVDSGLDHLSTTECAPAGGHFNPYNTSTASIYSRDCTPFNVLRCELGDLSAKMFTIEIPPYRVKGNGHEPDIGKFFGTDIDLPLCGPVSVVNRSVVVHVADFGPQRLACSTVIEFKPRN